DDLREAAAKVVAVAAHQTYGTAPPVRQDAKAVMLDLVNPAIARRRLLGRPRQAGLKRWGGSIGAEPGPEVTRYIRHQTAKIRIGSAESSRADRAGPLRISRSLRRMRSGIARRCAGGGGDGAIVGNVVVAAATCHKGVRNQYGLCDALSAPHSAC